MLFNLTTRNRILVVDDDPVVLQMFSRSLELSGFDAITASGGEQAIALLRSDPEIGLILLDLEMPGVNGWSVRNAQLFDAELAEIPTIVITGSIEHAQRARQELKPTDYLLKPVTFETLIGVASRYCTPAVE